MTAQQALELLTKVTEQIPLSRSGHQQVLQAIQIIRDTLSKKDD